MPLEKRPAQTHRGAPAATSIRPFHLRLPDVFPDQKPRIVPVPVPEPRPPLPAVAKVPTARPAAQSTPAHTTAAQSPSARSTTAHSAPAHSPTAQLREKRYQDGHQQVTGMIERMRERRQRLFGRLWVASIALTALSVVALAIELIQGMQSPIPTRAAIRAVKESDTSRKLARKTSASAAPARPVTPAAAHEWPNELPNDHPVKSALYTTEDGTKPKGVWLDGLITDPDPDSERPNRGAHYDDHQPRTR